MDINKLQKLVNEAKLNKIALCARSGISRTTLDNILAGSDLKVSTLESLSAALGVSPAVFFDQEPASTSVVMGDGNVNSIAAVQAFLNQHEDYPALLEQARKTIELKDQIITKLVNHLCGSDTQ